MYSLSVQINIFCDSVTQAMYSLSVQINIKIIYYFYFFYCLPYFVKIRKKVYCEGYEFYVAHGRIRGGVRTPPPFGPRCRLFSIGPKVGPTPGPPFFA